MAGSDTSPAGADRAVLPSKPTVWGIGFVPSRPELLHKYEGGVPYAAKAVKQKDGSFKSEWFTMDSPDDLARLRVEDPMVQKLCEEWEAKGLVPVAVPITERDPPPTPYRPRA